MLRATLPTKQGDQQRQKRIPIGVPATAAGLTEAESKALKLDTELRSGSFDWRNWIETDEEKPAQVAAVSRDEFLAAGKALHTRKIKRKAKSDPRAEARGVESWRKRWQCTLNKVPKGEVTEKKIIGVVKKQEEGSAARREAGLVSGWWQQNSGGIRKQSDPQAWGTADECSKGETSQPSKRLRRPSTRCEKHRPTGLGFRGWSPPTEHVPANWGLQSSGLTAYC